MDLLDLRYAGRLPAVFAAYAVGGKLGLQLATVHPSATAVWPPTGIALAACLLLGLRIWPAVFLGALVVNITTTGDVASSVGIAIGNTLEAVVGARLVERFANGRYVFHHVRTVGAYCAIAILATAVSASVGVSSLLLTGLAPAADAAKTWLTWWLGDLGGAAIVAPLVVLWAVPVPRLHDAGSTLELAALAVSVGVFGAVVFLPASPLAAANLPVQFLVTPVLAWPVVRFGPRLTVTTCLAVAAIAIAGALSHAGPFGRTPEFQLALVQAFMVVATFTALGVAAAVVERQEALEALRATEERLRVAEERKVAARDEFLSIAAHELRTPITSLRLATQYLLREVDAGRPVPEQSLRTAAEALMSQTKRLGELIGQLLDTARIQADRMDLQLAEQDVAEIARRIAREAQMMTARHEIDVVADGPVTAAVDEIRIEQVLRNLLDNAIKYSPGGEIAVGLLPEDGAWVQLSVSDHGPGIPVGARDRIFDRFYQARKEDKGGGGLGLGLHVSKRIVELHGGTIRADFPADGGTRIIVRLPAKGPVEGAVR